MRRLIKFITALIIINSCLIAQELPIIPQPQKVKYGDENFEIKKSLSIRLFVDDTSHVMHGVNELKNTLRKFHDCELELIEKGNADIIVGLKNISDAFDDLLVKADFNLDHKYNNQVYQAEITSGTILIAANHKQGMYYGIQTLKQLLRAYDDQNSLPGLWIRDYPNLKYRGLMDDISRGPIPTLEFMKYQIRRIAELKMNVMTHYVEHVIKTKSHPEFAPSDGSLTIEEWKEINDYAQKYFITLVGSFQSFGHFANILDNPRYSHLGESGSLISPMLDESLDFLRDIYEEMIPVFDSPWFAINCDETFDLGRGYSKALVDSIGYAQVYRMHVMNLYNIVEKYNKDSWIWGDIMLKYPELIDQLPKEFIVGTWTYDPRESFDNYIEPFKEAGYRVLIVPGVLNSSRTMPEWDEAIGNIHNFTRDGVKHDVWGSLLTVWDDGGFAFFSIDWYGVVYNADQSWNSRERNLEAFNSKFNRTINADESNSFTEALWKILEIGDLSPTGRMSQKVVWLNIIPEKYESINISLDGWDQVLEKCAEAEELLNKADPKLYREQIDYFHFIIDLYESLALKRFNLLEAADSYREAAVIQRSKPDSARLLILNSLDKLIETKKIMQRIADDYTRLWLKENHTYSLMKIVGRFNKDIEALTEMESLVFDALKQFDSGLYLPAPKYVRLEINEVSGKYFREWMMINPLPNDDGLPNSKIDYLTEMSGEKNAQPRVTQEFYYNGKKYRWRRVITNYVDIVDLAELFPQNNEDVVMYAHGTITAPTAQTVKAAVGSDDGITVWINGQVVYEFNESRTLTPDENTFNIDLKEGKNHLLIKVSQLKNEWGFTFRLPESKVQNSKNRYYIQ